MPVQYVFDFVWNQYKKSAFCIIVGKKNPIVLSMLVLEEGSVKVECWLVGRLGKRRGGFSDSCWWVGRGGYGKHWVGERKGWGV